MAFVWVERAWKACKLFVNSYISIVNLLRTDIHTYKHILRLRFHYYPLCLHDYEPHAKVFGSQSVDVLHTTPKPLILVALGLVKVISQQSWFLVRHSNQWMHPPTNLLHTLSPSNTCLTSYKCTNSLFLNRRKLHQPTYHWELKEVQSLMAGHNRRHLEDMTVSLSNHLQKLSRRNVRYAAWYFETHTCLSVVVPTSAVHAVNDSKLITNSVQHAGRTTSNFLLIKVWKSHWTSFMCCARTVKMVVSGEGSWESWSITWMMSTIVVSKSA